MPCNILVIPALVKYVHLIVVLKTDQFNFFKIQDLRGFELDTYHTLITRKSNHHISRKTLLPYANRILDLACSVWICVWNKH